MTFTPLVAPIEPAASSSRWLVFTESGLLVDESDGRPRFLDHARASALELRDAIYVGRFGEHDVLTARTTDATIGSLAARPLRALLMELDEHEGALAGRAAQILHWDETHRFCGRCGAATERSSLERARVCPSCSLSAYPRLSPAVIVLVRRGEHALLARAANFPRPFFSTLAGFVEPGESLEEAARREIREEVGVEIANLRYFGSQPWPFPHSLMVGFTAEHAGGELRVDGVEIAEAQFFSRDALPLLPPPISIARKLIDAWLADAE